MHSSNDKGFSLVESMVAFAILASACGLIIPTFINQLRTLKDVSGGERCQAYVTWSMGKVETTRINPAEPHPFLQPVFNKALSPLASDKDAWGIPDALKPRFVRMGAPALYVQNGEKFVGPDKVTHDGVTLYTPLLANDYMGYLADKYSEGVKESFSPLDTAAPELKPPPLQKNEVFTGEIKIELIDLDTNQPAASMPKFWPVPKNQFERTVIEQPQSKGNMVIANFPNYMRHDRGFQVTIKGKVKDLAGNVLRTCESSKPFAYSHDFQNVLDFTTDFNLIRQPTAGNYVDDSFRLSNKNEIAGSVNNDLKPIFTNIGVGDEDGRERKVCSQNGQPVPPFYLRLRVYNASKESGLVPMCIDSSTQWLRKETAGGGWCADNNKTNLSDVLINYDWKPLGNGWVPCEKLTFCNQPPDKVELSSGVEDSKPYLEYQYHYTNLRADRNESGNRLWGCELKFLAAGVDTAGNLVYPPGAALDTSAVTTAQVVHPSIREANPKIYFKPPPCYTCTCKPCKRGKGGFLGGFFAILVFIILVIATFGTAIVMGPTWISFVLANLAGICLIGGLGCEKGAENIPDNISAAGTYRACNNVNSGCKCGQKCSEKRPPGPKWIDTIDPTLTIEDLENKLKAMSCEAQLGFPVTSDGVTFFVNRTYKKYNPATNKYDLPDGETRVYHGDEVLWQEFQPSTGKYCIANYKCNKGTWEVGKEWFDDGEPKSTPPVPQPLIGCFDVRVAHKFKWNPPGQPVSLPAPGDADCLEVNFNRPPFMDLGENLYSYSQFNTECGQDTALETSAPLPLDSSPIKRVAGTVSTECPVAQTFKVGDTSITLSLAAQPPLYTSCGDSSCFQCWSKCTPPHNMPQGPDAGSEQKYYEPYSPAYAGLKFCTLNSDTFDKK